MGRHKIWRNQIKKLRRKRLRQKRAQERDAILDEARRKQELSPNYQAWMKEQEILDEFREEEESRLLEERNREWMLRELQAQRAWRIRQERVEKARKEKEEQELRIRQEWEEEQKKLKEIEMVKKKEQEEKQKKQDELMQQIVDFVEKGGERPAFASDVTESNPNMPMCPFYSKTGACRFGDRCSRNHSKPTLSKIVLIPSFYSHFGMDQSMLDEYDTDLLLEYEDSETYQHFREFYNDVVPELFRYGKLVAVVVCNNPEPHLRGNVYVEYAQESDAAKAVTSLNGRWYGGKLLSAHFTNIPLWKSAICGLYHRGRCPKGKTCNFLHTFHNPGGEFSHPDLERERCARKSKNNRRDRREREESQRSSRGSHWEDCDSRESQRRQETSRREWRWSESPERPVPGDNSEVDMEKKSRKGRNVRSPDRESREGRRDKNGSRRESREGERERRSEKREDRRERREEEDDEYRGEREERRRERREEEEDRKEREERKRERREVEEDRRRERSEERKSDRHSSRSHRKERKHSGSRERHGKETETSHRKRRKRSKERRNGRAISHSRHQRSSLERNIETENQENPNSEEEKECGANSGLEDESVILCHSESVSNETISYQRPSNDCEESQEESQSP